MYLLWPGQALFEWLHHLNVQNQYLPSCPTVKHKVNFLYD